MILYNDHSADIKILIDIAPIPLTTIILLRAAAFCSTLIDIYTNHLVESYILITAEITRLYLKT